MNTVSPVRFGSKNQPRVELSILGYQYPALIAADYDSNWLNVHIKVDHPLGGYEKSAPLFLTREIEHISAWFAAHSCDAIAPFQIRVMEHVIWFQRRSSNSEVIHCTIYLDSEFAPPWVPEETVYSEGYEGFPIEISLTRTEWMEIATSLSQQLSQFPPRDGW